MVDGTRSRLKVDAPGKVVGFCDGKPFLAERGNLTHDTRHWSLPENDLDEVVSVRGCRSAVVRGWSAHQLGRVNRLIESPGELSLDGVAISADAELIAVASVFDGGRVWLDTKDNELGAPLLGYTGGPWGFDQQGNLVSIDLREGALLRWDLSEVTLRRQVCTLAGRRFTQEEIERWALPSGINPCQVALP